MERLPASVSGEERYLRDARAELERLRVAVRLAREEVERARVALAEAKAILQGSSSRDANVRGGVVRFGPRQSATALSHPIQLVLEEEIDRELRRHLLATRTIP
jgi:hypothetical protein